MGSSVQAPCKVFAADGRTAGNVERHGDLLCQDRDHSERASAQGLERRREGLRPNQTQQAKGCLHRDFIRDGSEGFGTCCIVACNHAKLGLSQWSLRLVAAGGFQKKGHKDFGILCPNMKVFGQGNDSMTSELFVRRIEDWHAQHKALHVSLMKDDEEIFLVLDIGGGSWMHVSPEVVQALVHSNCAWILVFCVVRIRLLYA